MELQRGGWGGVEGGCDGMVGEMREEELLDSFKNIYSKTHFSMA